MIYTLTIAPSLDYILDNEDKVIRIGHTNRPKNIGVFIGGKGITVARMLNNLKIENIPILALGGEVGKSIFRLVQKEFDEALIIETEKNSRIDVIIQGNGKDTRFNPKAPKIMENELLKLFNFLDKNLKENDILIMAGSTGSEKECIYSDILSRYSSRGAKIILDTTGEAMTLALKSHPFLIKPNEDELSMLLNRELNSLDDIIKAAISVLDMGCLNILVTRGKDGAIFVNTKREIYKCSNPIGKQISAVGAGDSSIAGFVKGIYENKDTMTVLKYSMAAGASTAFSSTLGTYESWKKLLPQIEVVRIA